MASLICRAFQQSHPNRANRTRGQRHKVGLSLVKMLAKALFASNHACSISCAIELAWGARSILQRA